MLVTSISLPPSIPFEKLTIVLFLLVVPVNFSIILFYKSLLTSVGGTPPLQLITLPAENPFNT
jgi:hypothetical protein